MQPKQVKCALLKESGDNECGQESGCGTGQPHSPALGSGYQRDYERVDPEDQGVKQGIRHKTMITISACTFPMGVTTARRP